MSLWDFARLADSDNLREADYASLLATALLAFDGGQDLALTPGTGLGWVKGQLRILVLVDSDRTELAPGTVSSLREVSAIQARVASAMGGLPPWSNLVDVFAVTSPRRQLAPGATITGSAQGAIGTQVRWNSGVGFVTAGHVAPRVNMTVYDGSTAIGTVAWSNDPAGHGTAVEPDVAIVELQAGLSMQSTLAGPVSAGPAAMITVLASGNAGQVMGLSQYLYMPSQNATCGDTYFTTAQITQSGDSGGPVLLNNDLIGHVVGASPNVTSYVQDVSYQLREASNPLRSGLSGLRM
jgi:hypothetical protein